MSETENRETYNKFYNVALFIDYENVCKILYFQIKFARKYIDKKKASNYTKLVCIERACIFLMHENQSCFARGRAILYAGGETECQHLTS